MVSLVNYHGLQVVSPDPTGDGGLAIQNDLKALVGWSPKSVWSQSADPTATNDQSQDYYAGSLWLRTDTTPSKLFVCQSSATGAAVWVPVLLQVVQDTVPKLGGNLDVNGKSFVSSSNGHIPIVPNGTGQVGIGTTTPNSVLAVAGPISTALTSVSSAYTVLRTDSVLLCDATNAAFTVTLPTAASIAGRHYSIKRVNAGVNAVTVGTTSSQLIDGATTFALSAQFSTVTVVSDGTNWKKLAVI